MSSRMILLFSILGILTFLVFVICRQQTTIDNLRYDNSQFEKVIDTSKERERLLMEKLNLFKDAYQVLQRKKDSIDNEILNKTKERIKILKVIEKEISDINSSSTDDTFRNVSAGLSEIDLD